VAGVGTAAFLIPLPLHTPMLDAIILILLCLIALIIANCLQSNRRIMGQMERCERKLEECNELAKLEFRRLTELENQLVIAEMLTPKDVLDELDRLRGRLHECREESAKEISALRTSIATLAGHRRTQTPPPTLAAMDYESGIYELGNMLRRSNPDIHGGFLIYEQRLRENIEEEKRYGRTEAIRADRARIVDAINELSLRATGKSFAEWCK